MKTMKKALSLVLAMAMVMGFSVPVMAANTMRSDYEAKMVGTDTTVADKDAILFEYIVKGAQLAGTQQAMVKYRKDQFMLVRPNGTEMVPTTDNTFYGGVAVMSQVATDSYEFDTPQVFAQDMGDGFVIVTLSIKVSSGTSALCASDFTSLCGFNLVLRDGVHYSDLDSSSVQWSTSDEAGLLRQNCVVAVNDGSVDIGFRINNTVTNEFATDPALTYTGSDVRALSRVELALSKVSVNTPVELPTAGADVKVTSTATAYDVSDTAFDAEDVSYTYALTMKDNSPLSDKITVDGDGVITISAGAPEGTVVLTATASYEKPNGSTSTKTATAELVLSHGNATTDAPTDPTPGPGEVDPDVEKKFSGVKVEKGGVVVVTSATGSTYSETIGIPTGTENNSVKFVGTAVDQFGDSFATVTGTWDDSVSTGDAEVTVGNGTVTVTPAAGSSNFDYKFSATDGTDTYEAKVGVTVSNTVVVWPELTNNAIVYGQPISDFTFDTTGATVTDHGTDVTDSATFAWDVADDTATLDAVTNKLTMKVDYTDNEGVAQSATKDYAITVSKADQVITIAQDGETETTLVNVEIGLDTDLAPVVKNKTVETATGMSSVTYGELSGATGLVTHNGSGVLHGDRLSADNSDVATMTLTAAGNDNYNEATRTITFSVSNQILRANIVFDQPTPIAGRDLVATVTESTNPVQDNSLFDASGNMIGGLSHSWFRWSGVEGEDPVEIEGAASTMTQPDTSVEEIKVTYKPVAQDVGKYLILTIVTPTGNASYQYIDKSSQATAQAVIKGTPAKPSLAIQGTTTSSITITAVDGAEYALIAKASVPAAIDGEGETQDTPTVPDTAWQDSNVFTGLTPNTKYNAYIRLKETGVDNASEIATLEASTDPISIDPDNPSTNPAVVFTTTPSVTITGDAKYNETLTANLTDAEFTLDGVAQTGPFYTEYQWYRETAPAIPDNPETDDIDESAPATLEAITGATSSTYTLTADEIGMPVVVKVTPAATSQFGGEVSATTATVEKADATSVPTGITNTTKATSATSSDGVLSGVDATMEYRLKAAEGAEEASWTAVPESATELTGLAAGTYEIRFKETDTTKASDAVEVAVEVNGHTVTGSIISMNSANGMTYTLLDGEGNPVAGHDNKALTLSTTEATSGRQTQTFTIESIPDGTYTLVIKKGAHLDLNIKNLVVNGGDLDLTTIHALFEMGEGDLDGNGMINAFDGNVITRVANFNKTIVAGVQDEAADLDGNGTINAFDGNIITAVRNFNKRTSDFDVTLSYTAD